MLVAGRWIWKLTAVLLQGADPHPSIDRKALPANIAYSPDDGLMLGQRRRSG